MQYKKDCDGWIPGDVGVDLAGCIEEIKVEMRKRGRSFDDLDLRAMTAFEFSPQGESKTVYTNS